MSVLVLIDNYDSFTYTLKNYLVDLGMEVVVYRNDAIGISEIADLNPSHIVISPGPGTPNDAGISLAVIEHFAGRIPLLGVCLGHQAIGQYYGGTIDHAQMIMHGKTSKVYHDHHPLFQGIPNPFTATRYHSLVITRESLPSCLTMTAWTVTESGEPHEIMAVKHKLLPVYGVQFHPEALLTDNGYDLLRNFLHDRH